jgi:biopolymer transport protein ExbB
VAGRESGEVRCSKACSLDASRCHTCGDELVEGPEACDGSAFGGASCEQLGYQSGTLTCRDDCSIDASRCLAPTADWYDDAWLYRRPLTVAKALVEADLLGFPLLVSFADPELAERATSSQDFRFTMDDGTTVLPHETVSYDPVLGSLKAWVRVPALRAIFDTKVFVYYGNPSPPPLSSPALVWTEGFEAVWHLDEPAVDESSGVHHANSATGQLAGVQAGNHDVPGKVGRAQRFDGEDDQVGIEGADAISLGDADCTVSAWIRTSSPLSISLLAKNQATSHESGDKLLGLAAGKLAIDHGWVGYLSSTEPVNDAEWHQVVWTQRRNAVGESEAWTLYVDGVADGAIEYLTLPDVAGHTLSLGGATVASYFPYPWVGEIDEVTVSRVARSAVWTAVSYANQNAPETFATLGAEQTILVGD